MTVGERRLRLALGAGLGVVVASFLVVLGVERPDAVASGVLLAAALLAAPYVGAWTSARADARNAPAALVGCLHVVWNAAPLVILGVMRADALLLGVLLSFAAHLFRRRGADAAAAGAVVAAPVVVTAGFAVAPGLAWLVLYPAALATTAAGTLALQARRTERARPGVEPGRGALLYAVPLTCLLIGLSFAVHLGVNVAPEPLFRLSDRGGTVETTPNERRGAQRGATRDAQEAFQQIFPAGIGHGRGVTQLQTETVMLVRPGDGADHGQLYLRGMVLDVVTSQGATFRGGRGERRSADADGWIRLQEPSDGAATLELEVVQQPIRIRNGDLGILFAPERLLAIRRDAIEYDADGLLIALAPEEDWFRFRCVAEERRAGYVGLGTERARHPDPLYVARPGGAAEALALIDREAAGATAGARSDAERVIRLVRWFQTEFTYDLEASEFPGLDGIAAFVREKRGPCTWFASAATLMLRGQGIPTRIATGFIAKELDPEEGAYVVTSREGHAWIEVCFEDLGWVTFDPTPGDQRANALAAAFDAYAEPGFAGWARGLAQRLGEWAKSGGDTDRMRAVLGALSEGPRTAWRGLVALLGARGALALVASAVLAALLWGARRFRGPRPPVLTDARREPNVDPRTASLRARLIAALARLGFRRRPPQTLRELTEAAAHALDEPGLLLGVAGMLDRARFGGSALDAAEESRVEAVLGDLKNLAYAKSAAR